MQLNHLVTILSVACLLSACGFAPPAPPQPADKPRIAINNGDPRLEAHRQDIEVSAPLPEPIKLSLAQTEANSNSAASASAHADGATSDKSKGETISVLNYSGSRVVSRSAVNPKHPKECRSVLTQGAEG